MNNQFQVSRVDKDYKIKGSLQKKNAYFETMSQLTLPAPPLSPIETILIETILVLVDPSPPSLQLRHIIFSIWTNISQFLKINLILGSFFLKTEGTPL